MLPSVRNRFVAAYQKSGKTVPENAFVQIWNLFYPCNPCLEEACFALSSFQNPPLCRSESITPKVLWFAWGDSNSRLNMYKTRFLSRNYPNSFFYDPKIKSIVGCKPTELHFAKHPQGMLASPVVDHLVNVL
jgi:hypothetical protein